MTASSLNFLRGIHQQCGYHQRTFKGMYSSSKTVLRMWGFPNNVDREQGRIHPLQSRKTIPMNLEINFMDCTRRFSTTAPKPLMKTTIEKTTKGFKGLLGLSEGPASQLGDFNKEEWITVYKFPYIKLAGVVQRMKIYQTAITVTIFLPVSVATFVYGAISVTTANIVLGTSLLATTMLYIMGTFFSRLIGIIYVTEKDPSIVRIAHMTFWGNRKDDVFLKTDFVPFSELPDSISDVYVKLKLYSEPETIFYITIRHGTIYDEEEFFEIFGEDSKLILKKKDKQS